jgi:outer membrane protein TolC
MKKAGNWSALDAMRQQAFHADAIAQSALAKQAQHASIETLTALLGMETPDAITLPAQLPPLPATIEQIDQPAQRAIAQRLDVQIARSNTLALAEALGLSRTTAMVDAIRLSYKNQSTTNAPGADGAEVTLLLPLFDWTGAKTKRAQAQYLQAVHRSADVAIRAASDARTAYAARQTAHATARHYHDRVVPLRKQISDETLLRYNGMLIGTFELLLDARNQMLAVTASLQAQRDYWLAESDWQMALVGGSVSIGSAAPAPQAASLPLGH